MAKETKKTKETKSVIDDRIHETRIGCTTITWYEESKDDEKRAFKLIFDTLYDIDDPHDKIIAITWIETLSSFIGKGYTRLAIEEFVKRFDDVIITSHTSVDPDEALNYEAKLAEQVMFLESIGFRDINRLYESNKKHRGVMFVYRNKASKNLINKIIYDDIINN